MSFSEQAWGVRKHLEPTLGSGFECDGDLAWDTVSTLGALADAPLDTSAAAWREVGRGEASRRVRSVVRLTGRRFSV